MRLKDLASRIHLGEDSGLELKGVRLNGRKIVVPKQDQLADEFGAFAKSHGGLFVLGVNDNTRCVTGIRLDRLDVVEDLVREVCDDSIEPPLDAGIYRHALEESPEPTPENPDDSKQVLRVELPGVSLGTAVLQATSAAFATPSARPEGPSSG